MKNNMNKSGIEMLNYPIWILRIFFLAILIVSMGFIVTKYLNLRVDISSIESNIILQRIITSNEIMHQDKATFRIAPAVIDVNKINTADKTLQEDINFGKDTRHISAKITSGNKNVNYINKRLFDDLNPQIGTIFGTDIQQAKQTYNTFTFDNEQLKPDKITIHVLQQK